MIFNIKKPKPLDTGEIVIVNVNVLEKHVKKKSFIYGNRIKGKAFIILNNFESKDGLISRVIQIEVSSSFYGNFNSFVKNKKQRVTYIKNSCLVKRLGATTIYGGLTGDFENILFQRYGFNSKQ